MNLITEKKFRFEITGGKKKERLDTFLVSKIENATRTKAKKLVEAGLVLVNGRQAKASYLVQPNDIIDVTIPVSPHPAEAEPEDIPLEIVYEDEYLLIINKPPGMVVHPAFSNWTKTLVNALLFYSKNLSRYNAPERPGIVHRIDKDTSGLLVIARDEWTHAQLAHQFSSHNIEREYWAVVWGLFKEKKGTIERNISRSKSDRKKFAVSATEGKTAVTLFEVVEEFEFASLLKLNLKTGRTHQIRVHLSSLNHPVFGDATYGGREIVYGSQLPKMKKRITNLLEVMPRQALHAKTIGFIHPHKKEFVKFSSELPGDFTLLLEKLRGKSDK
jgi:23S rRNA pseudouridine1911/1915/1917 synthase